MQVMLKGWDAELQGLHERIASRVQRAGSRYRALGYLRGLGGPVARKNGWPLAEQVGERTPGMRIRRVRGADLDGLAPADHLGAPGACLAGRFECSG